MRKIKGFIAGLSLIAFAIPIDASASTTGYEEYHLHDVDHLHFVNYTCVNGNQMKNSKVYDHEYIHHYIGTTFSGEDFNKDVYDYAIGVDTGNNCTM